MVMEKETNIQIVGDSIFDLWMKKGIKNWEIIKLQQDLLKSPIRLEIQEKKAELKAIEELETERKDFVLKHLQSNNIKSVEFTNQKVTVKRNPWSVNILDEELIPKEYFKETTTTKLDKAEIKKHLKEWFAINGAEMKHSFTLLITPK